MKKRTPFWPLVLNAWGVGLSEPLPLILILAYFEGCVGLACWAPMALLMKVSEGNIANFFVVFGPLGPSMAICLASALTCAWAAGTVLATYLNSTEHRKIFEFYFTRAIDRRTLFRAKTAAVSLMVLGPMLVNLLAAPFEGSITLGTNIDGVDSSAPSVGRFSAGSKKGDTLAVTNGFVIRPDAGSAVALRKERYLKAFPQSRVRKVFARVISDELVLQNGTELFAAWMLWIAATGFILLQAYVALVAKLVTRSAWMTGFIPVAPTIAALGWAVSPAGRRSNLAEESFLLFSSHWLALFAGSALLTVVLFRFSERRYTAMEIQ